MDVAGNPDMQARRFIVRGRVQGVAYRASTQQAAVARGLRGWVRNLNDGTVEVYALGTADQLADFSDWLWRGPRLAAVSAVDAQDCAVEACAGFEIRR